VGEGLGRSGKGRRNLLPRNDLQTGGNEGRLGKVGKTTDGARGGNVTTGYHRIRSLKVSDGFLDGLDVEFSDHLNVVIGSRGSGKTTLLELIRFGLGVEPTNKAEADRLIRGNLGHGRVILTIETQSGSVYTVERSHGGRPQVFAPGGELVPISIERGVLFGAEVFGQNEIEATANNPEYQLQLIDRFADEGLKEVEDRIQALLRRAERAQHELLPVLRELDDVPVEELQDKRLELAEELRLLEQAGGESVELKTALVERGKREREETALSAWIEHLTGEVDTIRSVANGFASGLVEHLPGDALDGPNTAVMKKLAKDLEGLRSAFQKGFQKLEDRLRTSLEKAESSRGEVAEVHAQLEAKYAELLNQHEAARARQHRRNQLTSLQQEVDGRLRKRATQLASKREKEEVWEEITRELAELREERANLRAAVVRRLNKDLADAPVRLVFRQGADRSDYEELLSRAFSKARPRLQRHKPLIDCLTKDSPRRLVSRIRRGAKGELEELGLGAHQAARVIDVLANTKELFDLEVMDLGDLAAIEYRIEEGVWRGSQNLSTGQKSSAVLPLLLLDSMRPLVTDEIESHLDQATLVESVISQVRRVRGRRQLIFATHNANVPVCGDMGDTRVIVLASSANHAWVDQIGSVSETKEKILSLLEGGQEAFETRRKRYEQ